MTTKKHVVLNGNPGAGNPHVQFDEGKSETPLRKKRIALMTLALGCALACPAATELGSGDMSRSAGAYNANTDYFVKGSHQISSPRDALDFTFGGKSLTLGDGSTVGYLVMRTKWNGSVGRVTIPDLRMTANSGSWCGVGNQNSDLNANITILAPEDTPAYFQMYSGRPYYLEGTISGEAGTGLQIASGDGTAFYLLSSCANFKGSLILADTSSSGWQLNCYAKNGASVGFGSKLETFNEKAIWLKNYPHLRFQSSFTQTDPDGDNRGIWLENGGCIQIAGTSTLYSPIAGTGTLFVMQGGATLRYGGKVRSGGIQIQGKFQFLKSFEMVEDASFAMVADTAEIKTMAADIHPVIYNFAYNGGTIMIPATTTDSGWYDFRGNFKTNGNKITIGLDNVPTFTGKLRVKVMSFPLGEKPLTEDDFTLLESGATSAVEALVVETDEAARRQSVYMIVSQRVNVNSSAVATGGTALCNNPTHWSNGEAVSAGNDYFVMQRNLRSGSDVTNWEFPGNSLTFYNPYGDLQNWIRFESKHRTFTCQNLWFYRATGLMLSGHGADPCTQTFCGNISINASGAYVIFAGYVDRRGIIEATISGRGGIYLTGPSTFEFKADNSGYAGSVKVIGGTTLTVADEKNLGGAPTGCTDAYPLSVTTNGTFRPSQTMEIAMRKTLLDGGAVQTDEGIELTTRMPVRFGSGDNVKSGPGTWTLAAAGENVSNAKVTVKDGTLKVANLRALGTAKVILDGGVFSVDVNTTDAEMRKYGAFVPGGLETTADRLTVRIDKSTGNIEVPVMTVANDAVDALLAVLDVKVGKRRRAEPRVVASEIDGKPYSSILVDAQYGMSVIIR